MSVYMDAMVNHGKRIGAAGPEWCHMIADTLDELHQMAQAVGLRRSWFQAQSSMPHYDIGSHRIRDSLTTAGAERMDVAATYERLCAEWATKYPAAAARLAAKPKKARSKRAKPKKAKSADPAWEKTVARNHALPVGTNI